MPDAHRASAERKKSMRLEVTPKEPMHVRIKHNGKVVFDKVLEANVEHKIVAEHPNCGKAEAFLVEGEDEMLIGSTTYGDCECADGPHKGE